MELAKVTQPPNRPSSAKTLYEVESASSRLGALGAQGSSMEYVPLAELVAEAGLDRLGKNSGPPAMEEWCEKPVSRHDEERMAMLQR